MKTERIQFIREILITQMNHWALLPLYLLGMVLLQMALVVDGVNLIFWGIYGLLPLGLYIARKKVRKLLHLLLISIAVIGVTFLIPTPHEVYKAVYLVTAVGYVMNSMVLRKNAKEQEDVAFYPVISGAITFASLLFIHTLGTDKWDSVCIFAFIGVIAFYFVIYYITRYLNFLVVNSSSASHIPAAKMFRSGSGLVIGYTLMGIILLLITSNMVWIKGALDVLKNALVALLKPIFGLLQSGEGVPQETVTEDMTSAMISMNQGMVEQTPSFWFWDVLENIIIVFFAVVAAIGVVLLLKRILQYLNRLMRKDLTTEEEDAGEVQDVHEKILLSKREKTTFRNPLEALEPAARIRQLYRKQLLHSQNLLVREHNTAELGKYTARESAKRLENQDMAYIYEKARYSKEECTTEDVKHMRAACK